jgi:flagellar hook-basal body complex protein FliE
MTAPISAIIAPTLPEAIRLPNQAAPGMGFQDALSGAIHSVEELRDNARQAAGRFLAGEGEELHTIALATQRAELAFELGLQIRNKVVQAYQEVMRMQV